jgi:two-component system sensor histidine kinase QseC
LGTRPINELSERLASSDPADLKPLKMELPRELQPIQHAVNTLLGELKSYIAQEKRFIADASHELRTPLTILQLHTDNLAKARSDDEIQLANEAIQKSTKRLSHLVFQLMEMQKLEHLSHLEKKQISLLGLISDAMGQIESKHLDNVSWDIHVGLEVILFVEPALFQCILRNLLDNAAKYACPNSVVRVAYSEMITQNKLTITNQLPDNSKPELKRLGERFFRHAAHQDIAGSGIGLSIVRKVVELHRMNLVWHISDDNYFSVVLEIPENVV